MSDSEVRTNLIANSGNISGKSIETIRKELAVIYSNMEITSKNMILEQSKDYRMTEGDIKLISVEDIK